MEERSQALARFFWGFEPDGVSEDGMPKFADTLMIHLAVPPYTELTRAATPEDIEMYEGPFKLFEKQNKARTITTESTGYPLAMWPIITPARLNMLAARDIYTVEELAALAERGSVLAHAPGDIRELADRAKLMVEMTRDIGQYEAQFREKDGIIAALKEQIEELRATIKVQDGTINALRMKAA